MAHTIQGALSNEFIEKSEITRAGYSFWLQGIPVEIQVVISTNPVEGGFNFRTSHAIHTPKQIAAYRPSHPWGDDEAYALHRAVTSITGEYRIAVNAGLTPSPSWLVAINEANVIGQQQNTAPIPQPVGQREPWPNWASWVTIVEVEFRHVASDPDAPKESPRCGPRPDQMHAGQNSPIKSVTSNGLLLWLWIPDGSAVHGDWLPDQNVFSRRDGQPNLPLSEVRAWAALPMPIATS